MVETVFCNLAIWSSANYASHWHDGALKCLAERQPLLFCTDLTKRNATVFAAFPEGDGYAFEQWVIQRCAFMVREKEIVLNRRMVRSGGDASGWWVDRASIADFANAV
jgi:hypothetical protein